MPDSAEDGAMWVPSKLQSAKFKETVGASDRDVVDADGEVKDAEWVSAGPTIDLHPRANLSPRQIAIEELEVAAVKLRDAELAWKQAGTEYRSALDRFNAIVAPLPK